MSDKVGVAVIKYCCPICGQIDEDASAIALNSRLTKADALFMDYREMDKLGMIQK